MDDSRVCCGDVVSLYKAAFEGSLTEARRSAALAPILQNPRGFVEELSAVAGDFMAVTFLSRMAGSPAAPEPVRKAAEGKLQALAVRAAERERERGAEALRLEAFWGPASGSAARKPGPEKAVPPKPETRRGAPDADMAAKYAEAVKPAHAPGKPRVFPIPLITLHGGRLSATVLLAAYRK